MRENEQLNKINNENKRTMDAMNIDIEQMKRKNEKLTMKLQISKQDNPEIKSSKRRRKN